MMNLVFFQIDRLYRIKSTNAKKPTLLVTFVRQTDCTSIMNQAKELLQKDSGCYVQYDYSDKVRQHRKHLGERMIAERKQENYSAVLFDKPFINEFIYKYDDMKQTIVCIGKRHITNNLPARDLHFRRDPTEPRAQGNNISKSQPALNKPGNTDYDRESSSPTFTL